MKEEQEGEERDENSKEALGGLATKFWDFANRITAFAVLQMLATLFLLAKDDQFSSVLHYHQIAFSILTGAFAAIYLAAVYQCFKIEKQLRIKAGHPRLCMMASKRAMQGRMCCIGIFSILGVGVLTLLDFQR